MVWISYGRETTRTHLSMRHEMNCIWKLMLSESPEAAPG